MDHVDANGVRFAYLSEGTGPLVVLLHGFPDTAYTWDGVMPAVAKAGYRAVAPFMRGYHPTAVPEDDRFDSTTLGRDALALIDALGDGKPAIVVGHDWGASAAYAAAVLAPEKIRLLVTVAIPHPASIKPTPKMLWNLRHFITLRFSSGAERISRDDFAYLDVLVKRWSPAWTDMPASETARTKESLRQPGAARAACAYYRDQPLTGVVKSLAKPITIPTVSFAGEHDTIPPRLYEKARGWYTASYEVVQVPGGHFMHREHPQHFTTELVRVLHDKAPR